jgi:uncharacterized membrane protein
MLIQTILYGLIGLLLIGLSIPLIRGQVPPNSWYGFRTRLTLDNAEIWYPVNTWAGRRLLVVGVVTVIMALSNPLIPESALPAYSLLISVFLVVAVLLILAFGMRYARSLHEAQKGSNGSSSLE